MTPKQTSILIGGIVAGVLSSSYLTLINAFCCLGVIAGGATAVWHYTSTQGTTIETGDGAVMGSLAGVVGSILQGLIDYVLRPFGLDLETVMIDLMERFYPPDMMEQVRQQMEAAGQGGSMMGTIFGFLLGLVVTAIFGAIGGAVGAALFGSDSESDAGTSLETPQTGGTPDQP